MEKTKLQDGIFGIDEHIIPARKQVYIESSIAIGRPFHGYRLMTYESMYGGTSIAKITAGDKSHVFVKDGDPIKTVFFKGDILNPIQIDMPMSSRDKFGVVVRNDTDSDIKFAAILVGAFVE